MKRFFLTLLILSLVIFALSYAIKPAVLIFARKIIEDNCRGCTVSIRGCGMTRLNEIVFSGITVSRGHDFSVNLQEAKARILFLAPFKIAIAGKLDFEDIKYGKLVLNNISCLIWLKDKTLVLKGVSAEGLQGRIKGEASVSLAAGHFKAHFEAADLDIETLIKDFELSDKFEMTGKASGVVDLIGENIRLVFLEGNFSTRPEGGTLTIKDTTFLENMAKNSGESLDLVVESLRDYRYNTGKIRAHLEGNALVLSLNLDGATGKRNLDVILHGG